MKNIEVLGQEPGVVIHKVTVSQGWSLGQETEIGRLHLSAASKGALALRVDGKTRVAFDEPPTGRLDVRGQAVMTVVQRVGNEVDSVLKLLRALVSQSGVWPAQS